MKKILGVLILLALVGAIMMWNKPSLGSLYFNPSPPISIGTTVINGGSGATKAIYDNNGVVGEKDMLPLSGGTMTGNILAPDGTNCSSLPYSFSAATTTGIFRNSSNYLGFCANNANPFNITSNAFITTNTGLALGKNLSGTTGSGFARFFLSGGSSLVSGDFTLGPGWGTTATISNITGTDALFHFRINSSGINQAANPTLTFGYHDGTFTNPPKVFCIPDATDYTSLSNNVWAVQDALSGTDVIIFVGTPVAGNSYGANCLIIG